jgi:hypothetical protein
LVLFSCSVLSQTTPTHFDVEANFLRGNILPHTDKLNHLITGHPEGVMISFSKKTTGEYEWEKTFNYPDYGVYFLYQDFKNEILGKNYSVGLHYNFYLLNRNIQLKMATGIGMTTNPYDKVTNSKNNAFGSKFMSNIDFGLAYKKNNVVGNFGFETGLLFTHYSNGRTKSPNSGINTYNLNLGINYTIENEALKIIDTTKISTKFTEPIKYNIVLRGGINESSVANSGQHPFYHIGFYADKRISKKSALQLGTEVFLSNYNKDFIKYQSVAYPEENLDPNTDYKRAGIFIGHELFINRLSFETQIGYYIYQPYKFDIPIYDRLGLKYYINKKVFTGVSLKTHMFLAEALEFVIGVRI